MIDIEPFSRIIQLLLDETKPFPSHHLHRFSDISPTDLKSVLEVWPELSTKRKLSLLEDFELLVDSDTLVSFDDLARSLLKDDDPHVRVRAINLLWECSDPKLVPLYLSILDNDPDLESRAAAASILGQYIYLGELDKISSKLLHAIEEYLLSIMKDDTPDLIKRRALEALGASSRREVHSLIETAYHQKNSDWKVSAIHAMGRSADEHWEKFVLAHLFDQEQEIKSEAINAAGKLELESARTPLLDLLEDEEEEEIRQEIIWSLSCIGGEGVRSRLEELLELADEDEAEFLEEAVENLLFTEELDNFSLLDLEADTQEDE